MMEIQVNVECKDLSEAIKALAVAIATRKETAPAVKGDSKRATKTAPVAEPKPEPIPVVESKPEPVPVVEPKPEPVPVVAEPMAVPQQIAPAPVIEPEYTLQTLSVAGAGLLDQGKLADLMKLLATFNVHAITQLKPEQYPEMAKGLRELGAKI